MAESLSAQVARLWAIHRDAALVAAQLPGMTPYAVERIVALLGLIR